jgi:hypothetical protein
MFQRAAMVRSHSFNWMAAFLIPDLDQACLLFEASSSSVKPSAAIHLDFDRRFWMMAFWTERLQPTPDQVEMAGNRISVSDLI